EVLRLRADTPTEKIRTFVGRVRGILENHEGFDPGFPPSVKMGLADDAVTVTITYCYYPPDATTSDAFNEKITLQILDVMAQEGIHLSRAGLFMRGEQAAPAL